MALLITNHASFLTLAFIGLKKLRSSSPISVHPSRPKLEKAQTATGGEIKLSGSSVERNVY